MGIKPYLVNMGIFTKKATPAATPQSNFQYKAPVMPSTPRAAAQSTETTKRSSTGDVEAGTAAATSANRASPKSGLPAKLPGNSSVLDVPKSDTYGDNDTGTYRTEYTEPFKNQGSEDYTAIDSAFTITRKGQYLTMNGFANGHLMRWKFAAEEGPPFIRFPAILLALTVIITTLFPLITDAKYWKLSTFICAFHTIVLGLLIFILEGRVIVGTRAPTGCRARARAVITRYLNLFRLLWGRGLLYLFVGSMSLTIDHSYADISGAALMFYGLVAVFSGAYAAYNLDKMKSSLTDESFLWAHFDMYDSDHDNFINLDQFAELLYELGLEFDDAYTFKAFSQINPNMGGTITFEQFRDWWIVSQNKGRPLQYSSLR